MAKQSICPAAPRESRRLPFAPPPEPDVSLMGYLLRLAARNGYDNLPMLFRVAGYPGVPKDFSEFNMEGVPKNGPAQKPLKILSTELKGQSIIIKL